VACHPGNISQNRPIDRKALVSRHNVTLTTFDTLASLTVGNGRFAFTVDATGLQSFPALYRNGIPLGTFSEWGWHNFPDTAGFAYGETLKEFDFHGRKIPYDVQWSEPERNRQAADYFRQNPHHLHLGRVGLEMIHTDGTPVLPLEIREISQTLDLWKGTIYSHFTVDGTPVTVTTICHPETDMIAARVVSPLVAAGRLRLNVAFPYPSGGHVDDGCDWDSPGKHTTTVTQKGKKVAFERQLDSTRYIAELQVNREVTLTETSPHHYTLKPTEGKDHMEFSCRFTSGNAASGHTASEEASPAGMLPGKEPGRLDAPAEQSARTQSAVLPRFGETLAAVNRFWKDFWKSGGAVDFSGSTDPRAPELERRIVLSQYLTRIQCEGIYPPQETGLTMNSWYGKFHLEMHWWHGVHFALWNRTALMEKSLAWYGNILPAARSIAQRQGFEGVRWPKMTGPDGVDSPSSVGSFLVWQQPHVIYLAELCYRDHPDTLTLRKYNRLIEETAAFMASYAVYDSISGFYTMGPWLIPAQERLPAATTLNPPFELAYWYWGLSTAQQWRERQGLPRNATWDHVLTHLPPLAEKDSLYLAAASAPDSWSNPRYKGDHPAVSGALGMLPPTPLVSETIMRNTFRRIMDSWDWESTWGWDYPMLAMTATRLNMPEEAVRALLLPLQKNTFLKNGHNYQDQRLRLYLPGNGGLLTAVAMMCASYDGCTTSLPGFPKDGTWSVKWEGLSRMP